LALLTNPAFGKTPSVQANSAYDKEARSNGHIQEQAMPRALSAYLNRKDVPARKDLQKAIDGLKFKVTLDDGYAPFKSSGYLPCTLDGEDAGFNIKFQDVAADAAPANLKAQLAGRDVEIAVKWSGDVREYIAAMAACAALVQNFGAIVHDPDGDKVYASEEFLEKAREAAASI
jgi:hypothetical protein